MTFFRTMPSSLENIYDQLVPFFCTAAGCNNTNPLALNTGWQAPHPRPVPFTRATMPSSLPSSFNRMGPEVVPPPRPHPPHMAAPPPYGPMRAFPPAAAAAAPPPAYAPTPGGPAGLPPSGMQAPGAFGMHTLQVSAASDFVLAAHLLLLGVLLPPGLRARACPYTC